MQILNRNVKDRESYILQYISKPIHEMDGMLNRIDMDFFLSKDM